MASKKKEKKQAKKKLGSSIFNGVNSSNIIGNASNIVKRAAEILEENVAEGIVAAKGIERKFIDVDKLKDGQEEQVMARFRKDAHEAVDLLMNAISAATKSLNNLTEKINKVESSNNEEVTKKAAPAAPASPPILRPPNPIKRGDTVSFPMQLENESGEEEMKISFASSNLSSIKGQILARNFSYSPKVLKLPPKSKGQLTISLKVPKSTVPGAYTGLIQENSLSSLSAVIMLEVVS